MKRPGRAMAGPCFLATSKAQFQRPCDGVNTRFQAEEQGEAGRERKKKGRDEGAWCKLPVEWKLCRAAKMWGGSTLHQYRAGDVAMPLQWPVHSAISVASGWLVGSENGGAAYDCRAKVAQPCAMESRCWLGTGGAMIGHYQSPRPVSVRGGRALSPTPIVACLDDRVPLSWPLG